MHSPDVEGAVIVLGSGVTEKNRPRLDGKLRTLALVEYLKVKHPLTVIFTGGFTEGKDKTSEAVAMRDYVQLFTDMPGTLTEETAVNTLENLQKCFEILRQRHESKISIITNAYHMARVRKICTELDMSAEIISAEDLVVQRSQRHRKLIEAKNKSPEMLGRKVTELILTSLDESLWGKKIIQSLTRTARKN